MHGDHDHGVSRSAAANHRGRLAGALALTTVYMLAEVVAGLLTGSLALLADAAHMLTDAGGLALALLAINFAKRPATPQKTYGYLRAEILAALLNAVVLLVVTIFILFEAYQRFLNPPPILGVPMLIVAAIGLVVNLISMRLLSAGSDQSLNVQGAYFEVLSDMLGSLGVIIGAGIVLATGWNYVDPLIAAGIGGLHHPAHLAALAPSDPHPARGRPGSSRFEIARSCLERNPRRRGRARSACLDHYLGA